MQVSSYLKNAKRSMRHKLIGYMIVLAVLLVAALYAGLTLFGRLSSPKAEIKKALGSPNGDLSERYGIPLA